MSDLAEMLLNAQNIQILAHINNNYNLINHVPMPRLLQENDDYNYDKGYKYSSSRRNMPYDYDEPKMLLDDNKAQRRSRYEQNGRIHTCKCGKSFLSFQALSNHLRVKHPNLIERLPPRIRGRPRKYPPPKPKEDFETTKYGTFFDQAGRGFKDGDNVNIDSAVNEVFKFIYESRYSKKLFMRVKKIEDNYILNNLISKYPASWKPKNERNCDEVFYEYLNTYKAQTNQKFFLLMLKFILLFRECYNLSKNKDVSEENKKCVTSVSLPEELPDLCNEFYGEFLEPNDYFGIMDEKDRNEIVEIIQHFCVWLYKSEYTKSKLSLA